MPHESLPSSSMWPFEAQKQHYDAVAGDEQELKETGVPRNLPPQRHTQRSHWLVAFASAIIALVLLSGIAFAAYRPKNNPPTPSQQTDDAKSTTTSAPASK